MIKHDPPVRVGTLTPGTIYEGAAKGSAAGYGVEHPTFLFMRTLNGVTSLDDGVHLTGETGAMTKRTYGPREFRLMGTKIAEARSRPQILVGVMKRWIRGDGCLELEGSDIQISMEQHNLPWRLKAWDLPAESFATIGEALLRGERLLADMVIFENGVGQ